MPKSEILYKNLSFALGIGHENRLLPMDAAKSAAENGYSHFYINTGRSELTERNISELKAACVKLKLKPIIHGDWRNEIASPVEANRNKACKAIFSEIEIANEFAAPLIVHGTIDAFNGNKEYNLESAIQDFNSSFDHIYQYATQKQVEIWLENLPANEAAFFSNNDQFESVLTRYEGVKFIYDLGHGNIGQSPVTTFDLFHKKIVALSFSDNDGRSDTHGAIGSGTIDFYAILEHIQNFNWRGIVIFDMHDKTASDGIHYLSEIKQ